VVCGVGEFDIDVKEGAEPVFGFPRLNKLEVVGVDVCEIFAFSCESADFGVLIIDANGFGLGISSSI
jgi:hypothetical protein